MNREEKIHYLEKYKRAKERYQELNEKLHDLQSVKYDYIKTAVHKTLTERIHEVDIAYCNQLKAYIEIQNFIMNNTPNTHFINAFGYDSLLYDKFVTLKSDKDIASASPCPRPVL